jgi:hypothetical protein
MNCDGNPHVLKGTRHVRGNINIDVATDAYPAIVIAAHTRPHTVLTEWSKSHSAYQELQLAVNEKAPILTLDRPIMETILLMTEPAPPAKPPGTSKTRLAAAPR